MGENRKNKRWRLIYYLRVFDQENGSLLGHLVDITTEGLRIVSESPFPIDKDFKLRVEAPDNDSGTKNMFFLARSKWCARDANPDYYAAGFRLLDPETKSVNMIKTLIDDLSFSE